jgi:hypothetical protein
VYIHELVEIVGHNRARYMHHITANWSPIGQRERQQLCFGIWGTVGSTARWPEVINLWEYRDWAHLAENFRIEFEHPTLQDPSLAPWWAEAVPLRRGGFDRVLIAADWSPGIEELCVRGVRGAVYAHELVRVDPGRAPALLKRARKGAVPAYRELGAELVGAFRTALGDDSECLFLWAFASWAGWGEFEREAEGASAMRRWHKAAQELGARLQRFLMVDAPLSPLRTGRQPRESDRELTP